MTQRAQQLMSEIWQERNAWADTEEKLVAAILSLASNYVISYTAQNDLIVLDKNDMLQLAEELKQ